MALLELIGRLGLNTAPFESGLRRAKNTAVSEAAQISRTFSRITFGLLGIGGVNQLVRQTIAWSKDIDQARQEFKRLGIEIDEGALRSIKQAGNELERLKFELSRGITPILGGIARVSDKIIDKMAFSMAAIVAIFDPAKGLRFTENVRRKAEMRQQAIEGPLSESEQKKQEKNANIKERIEKLSEPSPIQDRGFDSLARIGGFTQRTNVSTEAVVQQIAVNTHKTATETEKIARVIPGFKHFVDRAGFWKEMDDFM